MNNHSPDWKLNAREKLRAWWERSNWTYPGVRLSDIVTERSRLLLSQESFGLTPEEINSIRIDIISGRPINPTPAYLKLFHTLNISEVKNPLWVSNFEENTPQFTRVFDKHNTQYIRLNHSGAIKIIEGLSKLFWRALRFSTVEETHSKIAEHKYYCWSTFSNTDENWGIGVIGYAWVTSHWQNQPWNQALVAWIKKNGDTFSGVAYFEKTHSVIPTFI